MWRSTQEYIPYGFVLTPLSLSLMYGSFNFDIFHNRCFLECCLQDLFNMFTVFLFNCRQSFPPHVLLASMLSIDITISTRPLFGIKKNKLLISAQNYAISTTNIKARIDKTQQNIISRLCGDREETINYILKECTNLAQKEYKTMQGWVRNVIHWELFRKFKFDHTSKCYMHNSASVIENETHKPLWHFEIQTDHLFSARWPDLILINQKTTTKKTKKPSVLRTLLSQLTTA